MSAVDKMNVSRPVVEVADSSDVVSLGDAFSVKSVDSVKVVGNQPLAYDKPGYIVFGGNKSGRVCRR